MREQYKPVDVTNLFADGGSWDPAQPAHNPHAETQSIPMVDPATLRHVEATQPPDATQQLEVVQLEAPLIPTIDRADDGGDLHHIVDKKAGRTPFVLAGVGLAGLLAVGITGMLGVERGSRTHAEESPKPSTQPVQRSTSPTPSVIQSQSPSPTLVQAAEKAPSKAPSPTPKKPTPSKTAAPTPSASPSPTTEKPSPTPSPEASACQWDAAGNTITVGECGDAIAYDEATGDESFPLTRGMAFDAQCMEGSRVRIVMANSVDYVNPGYFDTSSLPQC